MRSGPVLAIDIGGTKLASAVVDADGTCHARRSRPTPPSTPTTNPSTTDRDAVELLDAVVGLAHDSLRAWAGSAAAGAQQVVALGVGCGGPMTAGGELVSPLNIAAWRDFPLRRALQDAFGLPVFVDNDAKALARAEGWLGAARHERNYLAMVVSTGVGAGIVVDGRLVDGSSGNAGHLGHVIVEPDGRCCPCGAQGCLEAETSGTALAAMTGRPAAEAPVELRMRTGRLVGRAVASAVSLLDLRLVLVGGSVALGFGEPFFTAANTELAERSRLSFAAGARIVPVGLGELSPLLGAAAVALGHPDPGRSAPAASSGPS